MTDDSIFRAELKQHLKDVEKDILKMEQELDSLRSLRDWIKGEVETRKKVTLADVRDWLHDCTSGDEEPATVAEIASGIGCSPSQIIRKKFLLTLLNNGTIMKVVSDMSTQSHRYKFIDIEHDDLKPPNRYKRKLLRLISGGEVSGTSRSKDRGRQAAIRKGRRGHR